MDELDPLIAVVGAKSKNAPELSTEQTLSAAKAKAAQARREAAKNEKPAELFLVRFLRAFGGKH